MCPRAAETGLQVTQIFEINKIKMRRLAFLLGCVHCAREAVAARQRAPVTGRFPETKVDARNSCAPARCAAPRALQAAPTLRCLPRRSPLQDGGEGTRRPHPRPAFVPSRPRASLRAPRRAPDTRGLPRSRVSASRHSRCYDLVTSVRTEPSHVPSGPESWAGGPRRRLPSSGGRPHSSGKEN